MIKWITPSFNVVIFFYLGELREAQKLVLCCLPKPIPAMLSCIFGEKPYLKQCGSWFNIILVILLFPLLLVVAALALVKNELRIVGHLFPKTYI